MVASVVISALTRSLAITIPLINPTIRPITSAAQTPRNTLSVSRITTAATTPAQAITEPTDKSKCPDARQYNMVQAAMPVVEIARPRPRMFSGERKLSISKVQATKMPTAASSITQSSRKRCRSSGLRVVGRVLFWVVIIVTSQFATPSARWRGKASCSRLDSLACSRLSSPPRAPSHSTRMRSEMPMTSIKSLDTTITAIPLAARLWMIW
ncbi:hypothetical protein D9M69_570660 [compost metagenome]